VNTKGGIIGTIEVDVTGFFTTHHYLQAEWGNLGELTFASFSQSGTYQSVDGREVIMQKSHWLGSAYEMVDGGVVRGRAGSCSTQSGISSWRSSPAASLSRAPT
jgi:hypothetical protein